MALITRDRVLETSTTTGTGSLTLAGAVAGYQAFSAVCSTGDTFYYYIEAVDGNGVPTGEWETGLGTYPSSNTLARTTLIDSSTGSAINFSAGTKRVAISMPAVTAGAYAKGADIASAATISVSGGGTFHITGTTTITDIDFGQDIPGRAATLVFDGALTLTHNVSTLILPGGANILTAAGDTAIFVSEGSDAVRCVAFQRAATAPYKAPVFCLLSNSTATTGITAITNILWDTEISDAGNLHSTSSNTDRITFPTAGHVVAVSSMRSSASITGQWGTHIEHFNSSNVSQIVHSSETDTAGGDFVTATAMLKVAAGDYIVAQAYATTSRQADTDSRFSATFYPD